MIGGACLGILLTIIYDRIREKEITTEVRKLILNEMKDNLNALNEVLEVINDLSSEQRPRHIEPLSIEEIATRVEKACHRKVFDAYYRKLPTLGTETMKKVILFYDGFREVPNSFREIERFAGNIRAGLFQDYIQHLISKGESAINAIKG